MARAPWIWIAPAGGESARRSVAARAIEVGFDTILLDSGAAGLDGLGRARRLTCHQGRLLEGELELGPIVELAGPGDMDAVLGLAGRPLVALLRSADWKVIPLENLVAAFQGTPTRIVGEAGDAREAMALLGTLEVGTDGVVLRTAEAAEVAALARLLEEARGEQRPLEACEVVSVDAVGMGDRVCVDTASLLLEGQGILVGSQSALLALVEAETLESGYVAARPFRVNAGPVHAYTLAPGGRTRYLSELRAGDPVLVVDRAGSARPAVVGRVKVERRPLLLVRHRGDRGQGSLLLQNAETVRLAGEKGSLAVASLVPGDRILVHHLPRARHFGMPIEETIREQ